MSRLAVLEGNGLRFPYRMGAALVEPDAYQGSATARDFYTTDWMSSGASADAYAAANAKTLDPEAWPTLALFRAAHGGAPTPAFQDPGPSIPASVTLAPVTVGPTNPPAYTDAEYRAQAIADQAEADRLAALPRDSVTGPAAVMSTPNAASTTSVTSALPQPQSYTLPLVAAALAFFALKG